MNDARGVLLALFGAATLKIAATDLHLRYVRPELKWFLLVAAVVVLAAGFLSLVTRSVPTGEGHGDGCSEGGHGSGVPTVSWLLAGVVALLVVVPPPALGSYAANRQSTNVTEEADAELGDLSVPDPVPMSVRALAARAVWGDRTELQGRTFVLEGFVTPAKDGSWYVTRVAVACCAADGYAFKVRVAGAGAGAPAADTWVRVTGTLSDEELARDEKAIPTLDAREVTEIPEPVNPYESGE